MEDPTTRESGSGADSSQCLVLDLNLPSNGRDELSDLVMQLDQTFKRRNGGRNKHGRGHVKFICCSNCGKCCPKDKAIKRFLVRNIVEQAVVRDVQEACVYERNILHLFKLLHHLSFYRVLTQRVHSRTDRRKRDPPQHFIRRRDDAPRPGQPGQAPRPAAGVKAPAPRA
ncbi:hypothetical protein TanjilG_09553 [Lupinus angustifolius]|uniref:40S ribosomal protein S26 n=1 Tax=Lupinus angustifolius TaxID=3871 RepID=A0A1J7H8K3_LUPAN|nr:hypothetical protein TanjilG_09553 [Lupinus angustifolius]